VQVAACGFSSEARAQFTVCCHTAGDEDAGCSQSFLRGEGFAEQVTDHGVLKAGDEVDGLLIGSSECIFDSWLEGCVWSCEESFAAGFGFWTQVVEFDVAQNRGLDSRKREQKARI
jgi:hypothetical protein